MYQYNLENVDQKVGDKIIFNDEIVMALNFSKLLFKFWNDSLDKIGE